MAALRARPYGRRALPRRRPAALAATFATSGIDRFAAPTRWHRLPGGEPLLDGVAGHLRVETEQIVPAGDHRVVIARVVDAQLDEGRAPLLFHDGSYLSL